ncbi:glycerol-3-phosphate dehydrogenase/oxidase [Caldifermentibacillus hisashii]|uniref:glycerol-3-phosphate dehydrogenase/oxidase n=1 Tax=Caldifermentibacillus hisashii TaxID=996558 RepID=UPI0031B69A29
MTNFSTLKRNSSIEKLESEKFDLLIIGGGITGSGIALDAISRGLKVALVERYDFASGTSSRSTKLIHGGLKYLQNMDIPVVRETGMERAIVYKNALHLVHPIRMNFPIIKGESFNLLTLKTGLSLYDRLAKVKKEERHKIYNRQKTLENEPLFNRETVQGSGEYVEYRTDDSRLTLEVAKTAFEKGATLLNYAEVIDFIKDESSKITGVVVKDQLDQKIFKIYARYIVNAAGPWVDRVRKIDGGLDGKYTVPTKGIHIVFKHETIPVQKFTYFQHKGRLIAVIPRGDKVYVGSTETLYKYDMDDIHVQRHEVEYLIECLHSIFPSLKLDLSKVISSWAGVRPLIGEDGKSPAELSRHDEIFESENGLITIAGGKLTGYRKMAERVLQYIEKKEVGTFSKSRTDKIKLSGAQFNSADEIKEYIDKLYTQYQSLQISKENIEEFGYRYGSNTEKVIEAIKEYNEKYSNLEERSVAAEVKYTIENEMVATLSDFFDRRTSYLLFDPDKMKRNFHVVTREMATILNWNQQKVDEEVKRMEYIINKTTNFLDEEGVQTN